jgi:hypothetical protein
MAKVSYLHKALVVVETCSIVSKSLGASDNSCFVATCSHVQSNRQYIGMSQYHSRSDRHCCSYVNTHGFLMALVSTARESVQGTGGTTSPWSKYTCTLQERKLVLFKQTCRVPCA